jgi:predicted kinase
MSLVLSISGPPGSGKSTLAERLRIVHGFYTLENSKLINETAVAMGRVALTYRDEYEGFFREEQKRSGMAWIADRLLARPEHRLGHIGLRTSFDLDQVHRVNGLALALDCAPEICLERIDRDNVKNPTTIDEYMDHLRIQDSTDEYGSHLSWVMTHADRHLDTSLSFSVTSAEIDSIVAELAAS